MKKFKLNVIIASILSFGIVCSSSAFATKTKVKTPAKLSSKPVQIIKGKNTTANTSTQSEKRSIGVKSRNYKEPVYGQKMETAISVKLKNLYLRKSSWKKSTKNLFMANGWSRFINANDLEDKEEIKEFIEAYTKRFIDEFIANKDQFMENLKSLRRLLKENKKNLKEECEILGALIKNCSEIKKKLSEKN